ncbi:MAG: trypsin-like peptidase domain-containing protein [Polyangia bacterium]|jgi:S1-C subfamily serine protease|nr:trypsin-like peptidase domain-containing protein [Polyangia bacterium]
MSYPQVVKVFCTSQEPDFESPWQSRPPQSGSGSGVVIGKGEILTGAHVVADATFIQVQKLSDPDKAVARVKAVCHDCDLALLEVADPGFTMDIRPAAIGEFADQGDQVEVVGFPVGGEEVSVTEGVVSRVEVQKYAHSQRFLLAATVDAAINAGNSGGPVFKDGRVAGIAFQKLEQAEAIGEIVPAPIIRHFLGGIEEGRAAEVPGLGLATQGLENPRLRQELGLGEGDSGLLVTAVSYGGSGWGALQPRDVLMRIGEHRIANNGTVRYRRRYRTLFDVVLGDYYVGDQVPVMVWRQGKRRSLKVTLQPYRELVPRSQYDRSPSFLIYGGLVFQVLCRDLLSIWDEWWRDAPAEYLHLYYSGLRSPERQEIVVLSKVLADEVNVGYDGFHHECVERVNGVLPRDMSHFVELLGAATDKVELQTSRHGIVVLDVAGAREATPRILARYRIPRDRSEDLDPVRSVALARASRSSRKEDRKVASRRGEVAEGGVRSRRRPGARKG